MICPFCGNPTKSKDFCTACNTPFNSTVRSIAKSEEDDCRSDKIGPFSTATAKKLLWVLIVILLVLFVICTEISGAGVSGR